MPSSRYRTEPRTLSAGYPEAQLDEPDRWSDDLTSMTSAQEMKALEAWRGAPWGQAAAWVKREGKKPGKLKLVLDVRR